MRTRLITWNDISFHCAEEAEDEAKFICREIFDDKDYLQCGVSLPPEGLIIDVGANIGLFSLFVKKNNPGCKVIAIEPVPVTFELLERNLSGLDVRCIQAALGSLEDDGKQVELRWYPNLPGNSSFAAWKLAEDDRLARRFADDSRPRARDLGRRLEKHEVIRVSLTSIAALMSAEKVERVDLLKVDTEGSELEVLKGVGDGCFSSIRQVVVEANSLEYADRLASYLADRHFEVAIREPGWVQETGLPNRNVFGVRS